MAVNAVSRKLPQPRYDAIQAPSLVLLAFAPGHQLNVQSGAHHSIIATDVGISGPTSDKCGDSRRYSGVSCLPHHLRQRGLSARLHFFVANLALLPTAHCLQSHAGWLNSNRTPLTFHVEHSSPPLAIMHLGRLRPPAVPLEHTASRKRRRPRHTIFSNSANRTTYPNPPQAFHSHRHFPRLLALSAYLREIQALTRFAFSSRRNSPFFCTLVCTALWPSHDFRHCIRLHRSGTLIFSDYVSHHCSRQSEGRRG